MARESFSALDFLFSRLDSPTSVNGSKPAKGSQSDSESAHNDEDQSGGEEEEAEIEVEVEVEHLLDSQWMMGSFRKSRPAVSRSVSMASRPSSSQSSPPPPSPSAAFSRSSSFSSLPDIPTMAANSWQRLVRKIQTSMRGSQDDIGWLQREPGLAPVRDETEKFAAILARVMSGIHTLPDSLVYLLVPGFMSNMAPMYFMETKKYLSSMGLTCHLAKMNSQAPLLENARDLREVIEEIFWGTGKRVLVLGHSKGAMDAAAAIALFPDHLLDIVIGVVFIQSPYGGTPVASDMLCEGQLADSRLVLNLLMRTILKGNIDCLVDLTYAKRREFLASHPLPACVPAISFHSEASKDTSIIGALSTIAHAEVPWLPTAEAESSIAAGTNMSGPNLSVAVPVAAAMGLSALQLEMRYGEASDGLVARCDAEVPGSIVVCPSQRLDHGFMVFLPTHPLPKNVPSAPHICEALATLLLEDMTAAAAAGGGAEGSSLDYVPSQKTTSPQEEAVLKQDASNDGFEWIDRKELVS